jgi:hypothetical protein
MSRLNIYAPDPPRGAVFAKLAAVANVTESTARRAYAGKRTARETLEKLTTAAELIGLPPPPPVEDESAA